MNGNIVYIYLIKSLKIKNFTTEIVCLKILVIKMLKV